MKMGKSKNKQSKELRKGRYGTVEKDEKYDNNS